MAQEIVDEQPTQILIANAQSGGGDPPLTNRARLLIADDGVVLPCDEDSAIQNHFHVGVESPRESHVALVSQRTVFIDAVAADDVVGIAAINEPQAETVKSELASSQFYRQSTQT